MPIFQMKDMWYWSIINIPLKVYGEPAIIHELGSEYHNSNYNSAQGPLLLEDDNRRLRQPTTREEFSKTLGSIYPLYVHTLCNLCFSLSISQDKGTLTKLLGYKGIINTRRILIWRKILWSRICSGLTNLGLNCLIFFIPCLQNP